MKNMISYGLYPFLLLATVGIFYLAMFLDWGLVSTFAWMGAVRFTVLIIVEFSYPCQNKWKMSWASFRRDLKWMGVGIGLLGIIKLGSMLVAIDLSQVNTGILSGLPIYLEVVICLLVYEFFQYWYHRYSHEGSGKLGAWLWQVHVAHHLPDKVYLLMHAVFHPINMIVTMTIIQGSLILCGAKSESIFLFNALMGLQGLLSHYNVQIKAGPLNYLFIGTELHRYHHSANPHEAKNYGSVISFWDIVFGTFYYRSDAEPKRLGVEKIDAYPNSTELLKVLKLPFLSIK